MRHSLSPLGESGLKYCVHCQYHARLLSLPTRGEWIEICLVEHVSKDVYVSPHSGRVDWNSFLLWVLMLILVSPHSGRVDWNLLICLLLYPSLLSLPTRGEWIEINMKVLLKYTRESLSPLGESGLKYSSLKSTSCRGSLSPPGESGLKCDLQNLKNQSRGLSPPGERLLNKKMLWSTIKITF